MSDGSDESDKAYEATAHKLAEARKKGETGKSNDLLTAAGYAGLLSTVLLVGGSVANELGNAMAVLIDQAHELSDLFIDGHPSTPMGGILLRVVWATAPVFLIPAALVLATLIAQRGLVFAPSKIEPKMSRISVVSNAKNKFGRGGLFEFAKSFVKLCVYSACLGYFVYLYAPEMIMVIETGPHAAISLLAKLCVAFLFAVVLISALIGGIDALWQHFEHLRKNRMSHKEIRDETKDSEGDPHMKQERRQRSFGIAQNQMLADVPNADVVIVNPTHYAIAMSWSRKRGEAPVCVAKGVDEIAARIREIAAENGVPIHSDPPTARALYATTEIGDEITPEYYQPVAAAVRFAEDMRRKMKARG